MKKAIANSTIPISKANQDETAPYLMVE